MSHVKHKVKASCHEADCGIARREHILIPFFMCANTLLISIERCLRTLRCREQEMMSWWRHRPRGHRQPAERNELDMFQERRTTINVHKCAVEAFVPQGRCS